MLINSYDESPPGYVSAKKNLLIKIQSVEEVVLGGVMVSVLAI
jgi:hypothetical protein